MIEWYKKVVFENYANFDGRARRSEYWYFALASGIISIILTIVDNITGLTFGAAETGIISGLYSLLVLIPGIGVSVRRLHDVGKSGWFLLIIFIPIIGAIWLIILACTNGTQGPNEFGQDPKNDFNEINEIGKVEA